MVSNYNGIKLLAGASLVENNIDLFAEWLQQKIGNKLFFRCDQLSVGDEVKKIFNLPLPGILAVPLLGVPSSYLVWFRYEQTRHVEWGGKPQKTVEKTAQGTYRLSPRNSFDSWEELVQGKATPWSTIDVDAAVDIGRSLALLQIRDLQRNHLPADNESVGVRDEYRLRNTERKSNILNKQFKAVVQSSPDALAALDNDNCFTILNPNYQDMFRKRYGITPNIGDSLADLLSHAPAKLRDVLNFWVRVRSGEITNEENSYRDSDGREVYTYSSYSKMYNRHGKLEGILATIRDITKTKETEREVRELYQKYKLLMQLVGPLAWTTTASGALDRPQPAWEAYTGQHFEEYEGFGWADAVHEEDRKRTQDRWLRCVAEKTFYENDLRIWNAATHNYENFSTYAVPIMNDDNEVKEWFGVCISIQRLKEQEVRLESALRALQDSNSDLQHFAYVASHDLQEPLRMVTGYLTLIEKRYNDVLDDRGREFMQFAVDGAYRMKRLIEDLLTYSRVNRQGKLEKVSLDSIFDQICQNFRLKIKETNAYIHSEPLPEVRAIPVQMHQLFTNLLNNALKFVRKDETPVIRLSVVERKLSWQFSFEDNGIGIDPKYAQKVFNIFFRLQSKQKYSGTGLGLAICQRVVSNHGGKIWVDTQYQEGTRFIFNYEKIFRK